MADYGFRLLRDGCGKDSVPQVVERAWDIEYLREKMEEMAQDEVEVLAQAEDPVDAVIIADSDKDIIEVRDKLDSRLISWYEIEEFEQR